MENSKHTPLPWKLKKDIILGSEILLQIENICVMKGIDSQAEANAKLIVKAVNCHDELLEALTLANKLITGYVPALSEEHLKIKNAIKKATE